MTESNALHCKSGYLQSEEFLNTRTRYAELLVKHGLNVQSGQVVNISTEAYHRDTALCIAKLAYECGAKFVNIDLTDHRSGRLRIEATKNEEDLSYVPEYVQVKYKALVDDTAANLKLIGSEDPDILADLNPKKINTVRIHLHNAVKYFYDEGIAKSRVHWTVAGAATPKWGQKVFPNKPGEQAEALLWKEIFKAARADRDDCLPFWHEHNLKLQRRAKLLTEMKIEHLRFTGPGTDLTVGLSAKARFAGGGDISPRKVEFEPNIPTEEVFTTPDYRKTSGHVQATRPFLINGKLIENLSMNFENGCIVSFEATSGEATFREYISSDEGANRLGEVALVGTDSPIFQSGLIFQEILFDENAACHIAVGNAYKFCLQGGPSMSSDELTALGCNSSTVHTDMMISSPEVDVSARTYAGKELQLLKNGKWSIEC